MKELINNKYVKIVALLIMLFFAYGLINSYMLKGKLIVTVEDREAIITLSSPQANKTKNIGKGTSSTRLSPGEYLIEANNNGNSSRVAVSIKARQTTSLNLKLINHAEPVAEVNNIVGDHIYSSGDNLLTFLNRPFHVLYKFTPESGPKPYLPNIYPVNKLVWLDNGGLIASNSLGATYVDNLGMRTDFSSYINSQISYSVASENGAIAYLANKSLVFKKNLLSSTSSTVKSLEIVNHQISISPDGKYIFLYSGVLCVDLEEAKCSEIKSKSKNLIFNSETSLEVAQIPNDQAIDYVLWGPDGKLIYTTGTNAHFYDAITKESFELITTVNNTPVWALEFVDKNTVFYAQDSSFWKFDISSGVSYKFGSYQGSLLQSSFRLNQDKSKAYFSTNTDTKGNGGNIYSLSLR